MTDDDPTDSATAAPKLQIDWVKTAAGALAAVSSAVLLSTLGAAGTLIGAAVGSVAVTVSTAFYQQGLARSRATAAKVQEAALGKVGVAQAEVRRAQRQHGDDGSTRALDAHLEHADERLDEARADLDAPAEEPTTWRQTLLGLPWKRVAALAVGTFVVVVAVLSLFELVSGRTVSQVTGGSDGSGGTTITRLTGGDSSSDDGSGGGSGGSGGQPGDGATLGEDPSASPSDGATDPTADPTAGATDGTTGGTGEPTADPTAGTTAPTPTAPTTTAPTTAPTTAAPSTTPTPGATPSATPTSRPTGRTSPAAG